jgi:hypothetical protein
MKKILFIAVLFALSGCSALKTSSRVAGDSLYIGMPLKEFRQLAGRHVSLESMETGISVYRTDVSGVWRDKWTTV